MKAILRSGLWGGLYGSILGTILSISGLVLGPSVFILGFALGSICGFFNGIIGGTIGSPLGWSMAGLLVASGYFFLIAPPESISGFILYCIPGVIAACISALVGKSVLNKWPVSASELHNWSRKKRYSIAAAEVVTFCAFIYLFIHPPWGSPTRGKDSQRPNQYLLPKGYIGWVLIEFGIKGAPPIPRKNGFDFYTIPRSGRLKTSSPVKYTDDTKKYYYLGSPEDDYYYVNNGRRQRLISSDADDSKNMIWVGSVNEGGITEGDKNNKIREIKTPTTMTFFVGTEKQYNASGPEPQSRQYQDALSR